MMSSINRHVTTPQVDYLDLEPYTRIDVPGYTHQVEFGVLTSFAYRLADGSGEIVVATTRPETMLGDTAVAVHPDDARYGLFGSVQQGCISKCAWAKLGTAEAFPRRQSFSNAACLSMICAFGPDAASFVWKNLRQC